MFIKNIDGDLINSRYIARIYIEPDNDDDNYKGMNVVAEMANNASTFDETLSTHSYGDFDFDLEEAKNFVRSLENRLNQQNVFVVNQVLPVASCGG